jgi:hypothetical protein
MACMSHDEIIESLTYIQDVFPAQSIFDELVENGAGGDEIHNITGDDLAGACWHLNRLWTYFANQPSPTDGERLMAYSEVGKVINEARVGVLAVVRGIHAENTMVVATKTHVMEFTITGIEGIEPGTQTTVCTKCNKFAVPLPLDHVGEALMAAHLATCKP